MSKKNDTYSVVGDIGGTNSRFALVKKECNRLFRIKVYKNKEFRSFYEVLARYLSETLKPGERIEKGVFAVAGPVLKDEVKLTNIGWKISCSYLKKKFGFSKTLLVNDLYALAGSSLIVKRKYFRVLKPGARKKPCPRAFIAPGTGLGESVLVSVAPPIILPTEGGHIFFAPKDQEEFDYIQFLKSKNEELSWEKALSGIALSYWYEFFWKEVLKPEEITQNALNGDEKALKVIKKFFNLLGRKTSQVALMTLPAGGIYISGGVAQAMREFFSKREFIQEFIEGYFLNKKMSSILDKFEISLFIDYPYPVLLGALAILHTQK
ncbi:MAG: ROK family protein [Thermodesulfobacteria bacterium]|nr:ROK family protein [Thermodesulfobacteriota bacterium]